MKKIILASALLAVAAFCHADNSDDRFPKGKASKISEYFTGTITGEEVKNKFNDNIVPYADST